MAKHHGFLEQIATWGYTPCSARFWAMKPAISRCTGSVVQIFFYFQPSSWEDKQNVSNDERDMTVNDNEDLIYLEVSYILGGTSVTIHLQMGFSMK